MEILLDRDIRTVQSTTGKLFADGQFECFVMEDVDRGLKQDMPLQEIQERKLKGDTCIPEGRYQVVVTHSQRFNRDLPLLLKVPGYDGIRMHPGNTAVDTEGCILPGLARQVNKVISSRLAFDNLFQKIRAAIGNDQKVFITIKG